MRRRAIRGASLAGLVCMLALSTGCSADTAPSPTSTPTLPSVTAEPTPARTPSATVVDSQRLYDDAVAAFPYALPPRFEFPAKVPSLGRSQEVISGAEPAYLLWGCANMMAAWESADDGDLAGAEALVDAIEVARADHPEYFADWQPRPTIHWDGANERNSGESGLCRAWLDRVSTDQ